MDYTVSSQKKWRTIVHVSVPAEDAVPAYDETFNTYKNNLSIDGFRKGRVPASYIKKAYGRQIEMDAFQDFIEEAWKKALDENDFQMISEPQVENLDFDKNKGLKFDIAFDVRPEFEVDAHKGLKVEKPVYKVKEDDIDQYVDDLRQRNAMMYTVEDEARMNHTITADFQELDESGIPILGSKFENQQIVLSENDQELTPQLIGAKVGDERYIKLTVNNPEAENPEAEKAERQFKVTVKEIKERRLPELDDEFAKDMGEYDTLDKMYEHIRGDLDRASENRSRYEFENALSNELIRAMNLDLPESMLETYLDNILESAKSRQGQKEVDEEKLREYYRTTATRDLQWHLISQKLIEQEGIEVTDEDVENKLKEMEAAGAKEAEDAKSIRENDKDMQRFRDNLVYDKVYEFLENNAEIVEIEKGINDQETPVSESADAGTQTVNE